MTSARRAGVTALLLLPGALTVYTAFNGGGFFAGTQGLLACGFAVLLVVHLTVSDGPFAGAGHALAVAAGGLALLAVWTLVSSSWSDAPIRALLEFDRVLLYLLALLFFGLHAMTAGRLRAMVAFLALGAVIVCVCALVTRTLPDVWEVSPGIANDRLSYPITYWNALGLLAVLAIVLCVHFACSAREHPALRVAGAAVLPLLSCTLYLTFSRASIVAASIGVVAYLVLGRPRGALSGIVAGLPTIVVAVVVAYHADELATEHPTTALGVSQGHDVALAVLLCVVAAAATRVALLRLDRRMLERGALRVRPRVGVGAGAAVAVLGCAAFLVLGGPGYVSSQYDTFVNRLEPRDVETGDLRTRLTDPSSNGRVDEWAVAVDAWKQEPLHGTGAGTYQNRWNIDRPFRSTIVDAHSLYVEVLGELGLVGLALVVVVLLTLMVAAARRIRGPDRALFAVVFAALLTWGLRAGVDWDWEMPVVTLWVFCLGGAVLAVPPGAVDEAQARGLGWRPPELVRLVAGLGCLLVALTPLRIMNSQRNLNAAVRAYGGEDCREAVDRSLDSLQWVGGRPEPRQVLAYCDLRLGEPRLAEAQMRLAIDHDPDAWQYHYVHGVVRGLLGQDPRPEMRAALRLNPRDKLARSGVKRFAEATNRRAWQQQARRAPLPSI